MPSIKRTSSDAALPGPAQKKRAVGRDSCTQCKKSKVACRRAGPGPCERCRWFNSPCHQGHVDGRTNHAASELLMEKIAYFEEICREYYFLFQILSNNDPLHADIRTTVSGMVGTNSPTSVVLFLRGKGYSEDHVRHRPAFVPAVPADDASTLSDRRRVEKTFRHDSCERVNQPQAVLSFIATPFCPADRRRHLYVPSTTGHALEEAIQAYLAGSVVYGPQVEPQSPHTTAHRHKVLEEPSLSAFRTR